MCFQAVSRWLFLVASGGTLLVAGCPDTNQIQGVLSSSIQSFVNGVISLFVGNVVDTALGI